MKAGRLRLRLEFDGAGSCGWQLQSEGPDYIGPPSIQFQIESAIAVVVGRGGERVPVQGCGRTVAGVHAEEYFCHFDLKEDMLARAPDLEKFRHALNCVLSDKIVVTRADEVAPNFHALDDVTLKLYEYRLLIRRAKPTLLRGRVLWLPLEHGLDYVAMQKACDLIVGEHDFVAFQGSNATTKTTRREITRCEIIREAVGEDPTSGTLVRLQFEGRGFLKQMVRNLVGTLIEIGQGRRDVKSMQVLLSDDTPEAQKSRQKAGFCAEAQGLVLRRVIYGAT